MVSGWRAFWRAATGRGGKSVRYTMLQALQALGLLKAHRNIHRRRSRSSYHRALDVLKSEQKLRFYDDEKEFELRNQIEELQTIESAESSSFRKRSPTNGSR